MIGKRGYREGRRVLLFGFRDMVRKVSLCGGGGRDLEFR